LQRRPPRPGGLPLRSYTSSPGRYRQPGGLDVDRRVHIAVMDDTTLARPFADVQRQLLLEFSAGRAQLGGRKEPVDGNQLPPVPACFVLQHGAQLGPGRIRDRAGEFAVLDQVAHGKILDHDHLVFADESSGQLVQEILSTVGDAGMHPGHLLTGLGPVRAALLLTGQYSPRRALANLARSLRSCSGLATFWPVDRLTSEVIPASTPTTRSVGAWWVMVSWHR